MRKPLRRCVDTGGWDGHILWDYNGSHVEVLYNTKPVAENKSCLHDVLKETFPLKCLQRYFSGMQQLIKPTLGTTGVLVGGLQESQQTKECYSTL